MEAPVTPLRPPAGVTGIFTSLQIRITAETSDVFRGRHTTLGSAAVSLRSAHDNDSGHQSRPLSASVAASVVLVHADASCASTSAVMSPRPWEGK